MSGLSRFSSSRTVLEALASPEKRSPRRCRRPGRTTVLAARGEPKIWLCGGMLAICLFMIIGLLGLVLYEGLINFWPGPVVKVTTRKFKHYLGEVTRLENYPPRQKDLINLPTTFRNTARLTDAHLTRRLIRTGNFDLTGSHFHWLSDSEIKQTSYPPWAVVVERMEWGRFYGFPTTFLLNGRPVATSTAATWALFEKYHPLARELAAKRRKLEKRDIGRVNRRQEAARLAARKAQLRKGARSQIHQRAQHEFEQVRDRAKAEFAQIQENIKQLKEKGDKYKIVFSTVDGRKKTMRLDEIVRAYPANQLTWTGKCRIYLARWWEFLSAEPREANTEGGVFPAIWGTVAMTLIMSFFVAPFGVLAALFLREYAKAGPLISAVRIAVNNLAGVPSIVFGIFGLGFFCYALGGAIDQVFFPARLPSPTFGTGGLLWASLTLALLTLPVVIVATEEALAAVPGSMREGSYACGASKWQTIRRIVLPRALPGIMTGMILAIARGAGEVAPLMLVGVVKLAPKLPIDLQFPYVHLQRSFMHLGFHIYDLGFQSPNSEAAKPMVFSTTLLLIAIVTLLNLTAIALRARLRRRFIGNRFQ